MEGTVVSDDLAGEKCQTDDDQEKRVETGASDEQAGPETTDPVNLVNLVSTLHNSMFVVMTASWTKQGSSDELPRIRGIITTGRKKINISVKNIFHPFQTILDNPVRQINFYWPSSSDISLE